MDERRCGLQHLQEPPEVHKVKALELHLYGLLRIHPEEEEDSVRKVQEGSGEPAVQRGPDEEFSSGAASGLGEGGAGYLQEDYCDWRGAQTQ